MPGEVWSEGVVLRGTVRRVMWALLLLLFPAFSTAVDNCDFSYEVSMERKRVELMCQCNVTTTSRCLSCLMRIQGLYISRDSRFHNNAFNLTDLSSLQSKVRSPRSFTVRKTYQFSDIGDYLGARTHDSGLLKFVCVTQGLAYSHNTKDKDYNLVINLFEYVPSNTTKQSTVATTQQQQQEHTEAQQQQQQGHAEVLQQQEQQQQQDPREAGPKQQHLPSTEPVSSTSSKEVNAVAAMIENAATAGRVQSLAGRWLGDSESDEEPLNSGSHTMLVLVASCSALLVLSVVFVVMLVVSRRKLRRKNEINPPPPPFCTRSANNDRQVDFLCQLLTSLTDGRHDRENQPGSPYTRVASESLPLTSSSSEEDLHYTESSSMASGPYAVCDLTSADYNRAGSSSLHSSSGVYAECDLQSADHNSCEGSSPLRSSSGPADCSV